MFVLGHVGIGSHLLPRRFRSRALWGWVALGCLLPDLLDKPLWLLGLARGTRLFGHTLLFVGALLVAGWLSRRPWLRAIGLGAVTHLALDLAGELFSGHPVWKSWLLWPGFGWGFPAAGSQDLLQHLLSVSAQSFYLGGEVLGLLLLLWDWSRRGSTHLLLPVIILISVAIAVA